MRRVGVVMRYVSLFSGIEAATVAWEPLGWEPMCFCEVEPFPCEVLKKHYPSVPNLGDVTKVDWRGFRNANGRPDLLVGGSPCQSFSIAGGRESLDGESRLMFEWLRAVDELRPRWVVWENVPGALSAKGIEGERGGAFQCLLRELAQLGYGVCWRVLDAQFFGVAQRRRRVFLVGCLGDLGSAAEVLLEPHCVSGDSQSSREKRKALAESAGRGSEGSSWTLKLRHTGSDTRGGGVGPLVQEDVSATLATSQDQTLFTKGECLTPWDVQSKRIYAETQCGPSLQSGTGEGMNIQPCVAISTANTGANGSNVNLEGTSYTLDLANSNAVAFVQNSRDEVRVQGDGTLSGALAANEGVKQRTYVALGTMHQNQAGEVVVSDGISGTITSNSSVSRQNLPVCMASDNSKAAVDENLAGTLHVGGAAPMVTCMSDTQAHASVDEECCGTLTSRMFKDAPVVGGMVVRRLTPMECERLQGFKDGYTDIHVKCTRTKDGGYKAVEVEETPDTPRYKALGNSMAVPCMRWIGERIQEQEERRTA